MKICVLGFRCDSVEALVADESLVNLRRIMDAGLYGALKNASDWMAFASSGTESGDRKTIWDCMAEEGKKSVLLGMPEGAGSRANAIGVESIASVEKLKESTFPENSQDKVGESLEGTSDVPTPTVWDVIRRLFAEQAWDYFQILDPNYESLSSLDEQLGSLMELMDNDTILLVLAIGKAKNEGLFTLAAPNCPLAGEFEGAELIDLAPTLLDLADCKIPESTKGKSLVAGMEKKAPSDSSADDQLVQDRLSGLGYV
jgi:hypothetical protein